MINDDDDDDLVIPKVIPITTTHPFTLHVHRYDNFEITDQFRFVFFRVNNNCIIINKQ